MPRSSRVGFGGARTPVTVAHFAWRTLRVELAASPPTSPRQPTKSSETLGGHSAAERSDLIKTPVIVTCRPKCASKSSSNSKPRCDAQPAARTTTVKNTCFMGANYMYTPNPGNSVDPAHEKAEGQAFFLRSIKHLTDRPQPPNAEYWQRYPADAGCYELSGRIRGVIRCAAGGLAEAAFRRRSAPVARQTLQLVDRAHLSAMDAPVHPGEWAASSTGIGWAGGRAFSVGTGDGGQRGGQHPESGFVGSTVPVSRSARHYLAVDGRRDTRQAIAAGADGVVPNRSPRSAGVARWPAVADRQPAIWHGDAADGMPAAACERHRLWPLRNHHS